MYVTTDSLPAPVPLDHRFTTHWPRIPASLKCHGNALLLCVGGIDPFGKEFGSAAREELSTASGNYHSEEEETKLPPYARNRRKM